MSNDTSNLQVGWVKLGRECYQSSHHCSIGPCHLLTFSAAMAAPPVSMVTVCHSWAALASLVPFQVLFLLLFPMELPRPAPCVPFWCRRHSQMPLSWPKPLRWVSRGPPYSRLLGCCPGQAPPRNSLQPCPPIRHNCISEIPTVPSPEPWHQGHQTPTPTPNPHQPVPSGSQISVRLRSSPWFCTILGLSFPHL